MMSARSASFSEARLLGRKGLDRRLAKGNANSENSHPPGPIQSEACSRTPTAMATALATCCASIHGYGCAIRVRKRPCSSTPRSGTCRRLEQEHNPL